MAPKRHTPLEDPPAASSGDEDEEISSEEETDQEEKKDDLTSDEDEEDNDDEDDEPATKKAPTSQPKTAAPATAKTHMPEESESESESGSESESESEHENHDSDAVKPLAAKKAPTNKSKTVAAATAKTHIPEEYETESESESEPEKSNNDAVKPLASKTIPESSGSKNARFNVVGLPSKSSAKRPAMETGHDGKETKRAKKTEQVKKPDEEDEKKPREDAKKQLFQRVFSEDDEIALLQGILEYTASKGNPYDDMDAFYEYIKKSLNFGASKAQLVDKIRRLRKKYENSVRKGKNGEDKVFSKPHDQKAFNLWKKIWGTEGALQSAPQSTVKWKKMKNQEGNAKAVVDVRTELLSSLKEGKKKGETKESEDNCGLAPWNTETLFVRDLAMFFKTKDMRGFDQVAVKQGWDMMHGMEKKELEEEWKTLRAAQMEISLRESKFLHKAGKLIHEALETNADH